MHRVLLDLRLGLSVFAAIFGLAAAGLAFKASYQTRSEQDDFRRWYDAKWQTIRASPWHRLPEVTIRWLVEARNSLGRRDRFYALVMNAFLWSLPLLLGIPLWLRRTSIHAIVVKLTEYRLFSFEVISTLLLLLLVLWGRLVWPIVLTASAAFSIVAVVAGRVWLDILTGASINWAPAVALLLVPMLGVLFTSSLILLSKVTRVAVDSNIFLTPDVFATPDMRPSAFEANVLLFGLSVASSVAVTLSALSIGHRFDPGASVPQNLRMLGSNAVFDGATVVASLYVLARSIPPRRVMAIPTAVTVNALLGLVFAIASLWVGVKELTFVQVVRVLVAHSIDGRRWDIGPYFWAMHTIFLPLLIYLALVMVCWSGKVVIKFQEFFYGRAALPEINGLNMTARLLGVFAALFAVAAALSALCV